MLREQVGRGDGFRRGRVDSAGHGVHRRGVLPDPVPNREPKVIGQPVVTAAEVRRVSRHRHRRIDVRIRAIEKIRRRRELFPGSGSQERKKPLFRLPGSILAERVGFEPTLRHNRKPDFESGAFDHSATSPGFAIFRPA